MNRRFQLFVSVFLLTSSYTPAQISGQVAAPGQIVTLQVTGLNTILSSPVQASSVPLPTVLSGISILRHNFQPAGPPLIALPLVSVKQISYCQDLITKTTDCLLSLITFQMPFDVKAIPFQPFPIELVISENGINSKSVDLLVAIDNIHVICI